MFLAFSSLQQAMFLRTLVSIRANMVKTDQDFSAWSTGDVLTQMQSMHRQTMEALESVANLWDMASKNIGGGGSVQNIRVSGSSKSDFNNWNDRLIDARSTSLGKHWRVFMKELSSELDTKRRIIEWHELADRSAYEDVSARCAWLRRQKVKRA